jgi:hypothetical protein
MPSNLTTEKPYRCRTCGGSEFGRYKSDGRRYCPSCARTQRRQWYNANKEKVAAIRKEKQNWNDPTFRRYERRWRLKNRYGIDDLDYDALLILQNGLCAICKAEPQEGRRLCVDHSHATGVVRGLLCDSCNNGLARFKDNEELLQSAIAYLRRGCENN